MVTSPAISPTSIPIFPIMPYYYFVGFILTINCGPHHQIILAILYNMEHLEGYCLFRVQRHDKPLILILPIILITIASPSQQYEALKWLFKQIQDYRRLNFK